MGEGTGKGLDRSPDLTRHQTIVFRAFVAVALDRGDSDIVGIGDGPHNERIDTVVVHRPLVRQVVRLRLAPQIVTTVGVC